MRRGTASLASVMNRNNSKRSKNILAIGPLAEECAEILRLRGEVEAATLRRGAVAAKEKPVKSSQSREP